MTAASIDAALISGPMYDGLYERIRDFERQSGVRVRIGFRGTHAQLNAHLAALPEVPYDLISTHTKYAPSQQSFLAPLDNLEPGDFFPSVMELASIGGRLYGIPRNIDVRLLHFRTDLLKEPPATWDELLQVAARLARPPDLYGFVFCGMESGLFGTFFEWAEMAGARLFPETRVAQVNNEGGRWALGLLRAFYRSGAVPPELADWSYDEVHRCFRDGYAAMVCDWPGYYGSYRAAASAVRGRFRVARMPAGPAGRRLAYAGAHTFALTRRGAAKPPGIELLRFLTAPEQQAMEAEQGAVPVRRSVMAEQERSASGQEAERWRLLKCVIDSDLIIPPKLSYYPELEEILWRTVRAAMIGETALAPALEEIEARTAECVRKQGVNAS